jgi:hypothetical protein
VVVWRSKSAERRYPQDVIHPRDMADLPKLAEQLSSLKLHEAAELRRLLEAKWRLGRTKMTGDELEKRNIDTMGEALGKEYTILCHEVTILNLYWNEYKELFSGGQKRIDRMNESAPGFFHMLQNELFLANVLHICRLTDPPKSVGKSNLTICRLPELTSDVALQGALMPLLKVADDKTAFARDWRNRRFGHYDLGLALGDAVEPLAQATRAETTEAISAIAAVLNAVEFHYFRGGTSFDFVQMPRGALTLLYLLGDGLKQKAERGERLKKGEVLDSDMPEQI